MSLEASSTPAKSPAFAGKARATAAVHPEKSARHPSARTTARMTCIVVPLALPACNRVLTTSNLATVVGSMVHAACFLQHGVCGLFSVEAGGDSRRLSKCGQRPTGRPAAALGGGEPSATSADRDPEPQGAKSASMHRQVGAVRLFATRPHGMMSDQPKLPARPVGRQVGSLRPRAL